jgi:membrane protein implicated in regulation of membrane protease activity
LRLAGSGVRSASMDLWVIWIIVACAFAAGEIISLGFFLAPFAGGSLLAAAVDAAGAPGFASIATFLVASALMFGFLRPVVRRHALQPAASRTGAQALLGQSVLVLEPIDNDHGTGTVKLSGEIWTARSYLDDHPIPAGTRVEVVEIRGATALVTE